MTLNRVRPDRAAQAVAVVALQQQFTLLAQLRLIEDTETPGVLEMIPIYSFSARNIANKEDDRKSDPSDFARSQLHLQLANGD